MSQPKQRLQNLYLSNNEIAKLLNPLKTPILDNPTPTPDYRFEFFFSLSLAIIATLLVEHSTLDISISQLFYQGNGDWLITKGTKLPDWIFYTGIKRLLIIFEVYVMLAGLQRVFMAKNPQHKLAQPLKIFQPFARFSARELGYLAGVMLLVPTIVATLKAITNVPCPNNLLLFGGKFEYLSLWQDIINHSGQKCFPAAHASSGFALYAWAFLPSLKKYRWQIAIGVTILAWAMGLYKMAIGDHFFSHTLVSMCLAWAICSAMAWLIFKK